MKEVVQEYYGKTLTGSSDLKTNACCTDEGLPDYVKPILGLLHDEVLSRYYGCGLVLPEALEELTVLDLGCGAGRDVYVLSRLVGERGRVIGVDMTAEQLAIARKHEEYHRNIFGYQRSNVTFLKGDIEALDDLGLADASIDVIVSNCVINLSLDKVKVFREAYRVLKPGGEIYFSDVYADRRIAEDLVQDTVLYGECLSGALYWNDFLQMAKAQGFGDCRLVTDRPILLENQKLREKTGNIRFFSATYRLFKIPGLEPACEDYGQSVVYRGTLRDHPHVFRFDKHHRFETGKNVPVCGNTWKMLRETRFSEQFDFHGTFENHYGIFPGCGVILPFNTADGIPSNGCC